MIQLAVDRTAPWMSPSAPAAVCAEDPEKWWEPAGTPGANEARAACGSCPLLDACRQYALDNREDAGVWGGLDAHDRWEIHRRGAEPAHAARRMRQERWTLEGAREAASVASTLGITRAAEHYELTPDHLRRVLRGFGLYHSRRPIDVGAARRMLGRGATRSEAAAELGVHPHSVQRALSRARQKLAPVT